MKLEIRRVILFVQDLTKVGAFYRDVLGLPIKVSPDDPKAWLEFEAGSCSIALHDGGGALGAGRRQPKIVFYAEDVAQVRAELMARGAKLGAVQDAGEFQFCDGKDPEGNPYSISSRP
jgi:catechol 2,3-dioxygenase-like lactoylglutathione lyase family enzyme